MVWGYTSYANLHPEVESEVAEAIGLMSGSQFRHFLATTSRVWWSGFAKAHKELFIGLGIGILLLPVALVNDAWGKAGFLLCSYIGGSLVISATSFLRALRRHKRYLKTIFNEAHFPREHPLPLAVPGKTRSIIGAWLQIIGALTIGIGFAVGGRGDDRWLLPILIALGLIHIGYVLLCPAVSRYRYRSRWFFWFLIVSGILSLPLFPFGTACGLFFLIYSLMHRQEFRAEDADELPTAQSNEQRNGRQRPPPPVAEESAHHDQFRTEPVSEEAVHARVLGLRGRVSLSDIKRLYRERMMEYHPDRVAALGPKLREVAEHETKRINEAYEFFIVKYGPDRNGA